LKKQIIQSVLLEALLLLGLTTPAAGQSSTRGVVIPPHYDTFQPPPVHNSYVDPVFGTKVTRISNALATPNAAGSGYLTWISDEYSTMSPFNSDNSKILLVHQSYFGLYDGTGFYIRDLPLEISASSEPRWSRRDNHTLYYVHNNQLKTYDISTGVSFIVHTFSEYSAISGMGQSDISFDGDHFVFAGDSRYVFVYQISTGTKSSAFDTGVTGFDSICITPRNNVIISWLQSGTGRNTGQELFDGNMNFLRQVGRADGHSDVTLDTNGDEVLVWTNSADPQPICNNGIVKIRLADGTQTCLATLDFSLAVHISAPDNAGFVYVETYAPSNPSPSTSGWVEYTNELLQIKLDGSQVLRLAHHRSRPHEANTYNWQPKISTSRDGSRVVYTSDYDLQIIDGYATQYGDTYLILIVVPARAGVYYQNTWYLNVNGTGIFGPPDEAFVWGNASSTPVVGDWSGNGHSKAGVYAVGGLWYLDVNGTGVWATGDRAFQFGSPTASAIPVVGDWTGDGKTKVGYYEPTTGFWYLDANNDGALDAGDYIYNWGGGQSIPLVGDWNHDGRSKVGIYDQGIWYLDANGDGVFDQGDKAYSWGQGSSVAVPVIGDWNGDGRIKIGVYIQGIWYLDANGDGVFDSGDFAFQWGNATMTPVVGDWSGNGKTKWGAIDAQSNWYLDVNGDTVFDAGDKAFAWGLPGDVPLIGKW
jgi:hypothetical protein